MPETGLSGILKWLNDMLDSDSSAINVAFKNGDAQTFLQLVLGAIKVLETEQTTDLNKEIKMKVNFSQILCFRVHWVSFKIDLCLTKGFVVKLMSDSFRAESSIWSKTKIVRNDFLNSGFKLIHVLDVTFKVLGRKKRGYQRVV